MIQVKYYKIYYNLIRLTNYNLVNNFTSDYNTNQILLKILYKILYVRPTIFYISVNFEDETILH